MNTAEKQESVEQIGNFFRNSAAAFVVNAASIQCGELTKLRRKLKSSGSHIRVVKNTLVRRAIKDTSAEKLDEFLTGPSAVIWSEKDPVTPAKVLAEFAKDNEKFVIKGAFVDGAVVRADGVEALSKLPSKEELIAKLLALINAPAVKLLQTVNAPATNLTRVLEAWRGELEKRG